MTLHHETISPTQRKAIETHDRFKRKIEHRAVPDSPIVCPSASVRAEMPQKPLPPSRVSIIPIDLGSDHPQHDHNLDAPLNPALTFTTFVQGPGNALVCTAATRILKCPGEYSPLVLHGRPGVGKTHLLQAIAHHANGGALYLTSAWFVANLDQIPKLYNSAYRIFLIDDIQLIRGRRECDALLSLMRTIQLRPKHHLVMTCDDNPCDLDIGEAIKSRLSGGLVLQVPPHDRAVRMEMLKARFAEAKIDIPSDCLNYLADVLAGGMELQGVVNRLIIGARFGDTLIDMASVTYACLNLVRENEPDKITVKTIQKIVGQHYNISQICLNSSRRTANVVRPRQIAMYLAKTMTSRSLPEIGRRFGGKDHTTVLHAVRKMEALRSKDEGLAQEIAMLEQMIKAGLS